jgi:hypothetical protein
LALVFGGTISAHHPRPPEDALIAARPSSPTLVLDLARRLAEEFDSVPLPMVSRAVKAATEAARLFGEDVASALATIEQLAREDLVALRDAAAEVSLAL